MSSVAVVFDRQNVDSALEEMERELLDLVRPAAQAGAQVLYDEVKTRVSSIGRVSGNLAASIYQAWSRDQSVDGRSVYHISWNARKAPHGHLVEYGHIQTRKVYLGKDGKWYTSKERLSAPRRVAAKPFLRPAHDAKSATAAAAASQRYEDGMRELLARIA
jgi:hypothetical protein